MLVPNIAHAHTNTYTNAGTCMRMQQKPDIGTKTIDYKDLQKWEGEGLDLGKPSCKKSAVFFNIVQKAFDPPPFI